MIRQSVPFASQGEAEAFAQQYKARWGFGYDGRAKVRADSLGNYVVDCSRFKSCD